MKLPQIIALLLIIVAFGLGLVTYPQLPEKMASHWNAAGEVNGYMPKIEAVYFMPILAAFLYVGLNVAPLLDPKGKNIAKFRQYYDWFIATLIGFLLYLYILSLAWNLGFHFNLNQLLAPAFSVLCYAIGMLTEKAQPNWFIGIRTPWTLSNDKVWAKTHAQAGILFKGAAGVSLLGIVAPAYAIWFILLPIVLVSLYLLAYSYFLFRQISR